MKTALIAAALAISGTTVAFGEPYYPPLPSMVRAMTAADPLLDQLAVQTAAAGVFAPQPSPLQAPIVISFGRGGLVDVHRREYANYQSRKLKVEIRGPCYSACTFVLAYIAPDKLCIAPNAFMAFHAIRTSEHGEKMPGATQKYYSELPELVRLWIDANGGWQNLPLNGYWTMHDRELWALGYPKCQ